MIKTGASRFAFKQVKSLAKKDSKFLCALYSTKNESPKAKQLREEGRKLDKELEELLTGNLVRRVIYDKTKPNDLTEDMYKDGRKLVRLLNRFAGEGKNELTFSGEKKKPVTVTVTGAAGQIAYSLLPRIARGEMLGEDQPIILRLLEVPQAAKALEGTVMELQDCAFPLVEQIIPCTDSNEAFKNSDYAILVGAKPRTKGMERGDLLKENAKLFAEQGKALNKNANSGVLVLVVGNPANTNALICSTNARDIPKPQFSALTRLDHDRGLGMIAKKVGCDVSDIDRFCVWGNHSSTMYPDLSHTTISNIWFRKLIKDEKWVTDQFIPAVQKRGAAIIDARGKSSAASAADASIKHMRDWVMGSSDWVSMAVYSEGAYEIPSGIFCSYPIICSGGGQFSIVDKLPIDEFSAEKINASCKELLEEREAIRSLLPNPVVRFFEVDKEKVFKREYAVQD